MPNNAWRLVWVSEDDLVNRCSTGPSHAAGVCVMVEERLRVAPVPVKRERCVTKGHHDAEKIPGTEQCWAYSWQWGNGKAGVRPGCRFVSEYCVPAPEGES